MGKLRNQYIILATLGVLAGEVILHSTYDVPFRSLLWNESWLSDIVAWFGISWREWLEYYATDARIILIQHSGGAFLMIVLLVTVAQFITKRIWPIHRLLLQLAGAYLIVVAFLHWISRFGFVVEFFEYALRFGSPILLAMVLKKNENRRKLILSVRILITLTFVAHGLYALGIYPIPASFKEMVFNITGWESQRAASFLMIVGWLDILVGMIIWLPDRYARWALLYAAIWGLITTLARPLAYLPLGTDPLWVIAQTLIRLPHFLIPVWLWAQVKNRG